MRKLFRSFDHIHTEDSWKQEVYERIEQPRKKRIVWLRYAIVVVLLVIVSTGVVVAQQDSVKQWLQEQFSPKEELPTPPTLTQPKPQGPEPVIQDYEVSGKLSDQICWIDQNQMVYAEGSCEQLSRDSVTVKQVLGKEQTLDVQQVRTRLFFEGKYYPVSFDYLAYQETYFIFPLSNDIGLTYVHSFPGLKQQVIIGMRYADAISEYLLDMTTLEVTPIGNEQLIGKATSNQTIRKIAYDTHVSEQGSYFLYRCSYVDGVWVDDKKDQVWILQDQTTKETRVLDRVGGGLVGNEITFIGDSLLLTTQEVWVGHSGSSYPIVYNCQSNTWTDYDEYTYNQAQQFTGLLLKQETSSYTLLNLHTMTTQTYPFALEASDIVVPYATFDAIEKINGHLKGIYFREQQRYVVLNETEEFQFQMIYPLDDTHLLIDQRYILSFI